MATPRARPQDRSVLRLELLEERVVPSLMVTTTLDEQDGGTLANPAGTDGKLSLREAISVANLTSGASTIVLPAGIFTLSLTGANEDNNATGDLDIKHSLTIQGAGQTSTIIDGGQIDRVFDIHGAISVTFMDVTIAHGLLNDTTSNGAGIEASDTGAQLTLTRVTMTHNRSGNLGGAIDMAGSTLTLSQCDLENNHAASGAGIYDGGSGSVMLTDSTLKTNSTTGAAGSASAFAAAIAVNGSSVSVTGGMIADNTVTYPTGSSDFAAGAIYANGGAVTVTNCTISGNTINASSLLSSNSAGAIANNGGNVSAMGSTIERNTVNASSISHDSAAGITSDGGMVTLQNSAVDMNTLGNPGATATSNNAAGIASNGGSVSLTSSSVSGNLFRGTSFGNDNAGGIATNGGSIDLTSSSVNQNILAKGAGSAGIADAGGITSAGAGVTLSMSTVSGNHFNVSSLGNGGAGAIATAGGPVFLTSSKLAFNSAGMMAGTAGNFCAGGVATMGGFASVVGTLVRQNSILGATLFTGNGGGLATESGGILISDNSIIEGNSSDASGGGINNAFSPPPPVAHPSQPAPRVPQVPRGEIRVINSIITGNTAAQRGGGIDFSNIGALIVDQSTISDNTAGTSGGGIYYEQGGIGLPAIRFAVTGLRPKFAPPPPDSVAITNSAFIGNSSTNNGGGFYLLAPPADSSTTFDLTNDTFVRNTATGVGGAIFVASGSQSVAPLALRYLTIDQNSALSGGGVYVNTGATATLTDLIVAHSTSGNNFAGAGTFTDLHNNLSSDNSGSTFLTDTSDFNNTEPRLAPLQDNGGPTFTEALLFNSPAINAGAAINGITTDQRGVTRPQGSAPDIGAYEFVPNAHLFAITSRTNGVDTSIGVFSADFVPLHSLFSTTPFTGWQGQVRVAVADVNNDGVPDIIAGKGPGGDSEVRVFSGVDGSALSGAQYDFTAFPGFTGGVFLAAGDFNGDHQADIVVTKDVGGTARVKVYSGADGSVLSAFNAFAPPFMGGARPAVADINGDGRNDLVIASGPQGPPIVEVFDGISTSFGPADFRNANGVLAPIELDRFFAFNDQNYLGGLLVAAGDLNNDGKAEIVLGTANLPPSPGHEMVNNMAVDLEVVDGATMNHQDFNIYPDSTDGVRVAILQDVNNAVVTGAKAPAVENDTLSEIVTAPGAGGGSLGKILDGDSPTDPLIGQFTEPGGNPNGLCIAGQ